MARSENPNALLVEGLSKTYRVPIKESGLWGSVRALFQRNFREVPAVQEASFHIEEGELVGFLGANGAGKTTTLKMLSGLLHPTQGSAQVLGYVPWERKREFQRLFSLVMAQRSQLWWEIPCQETFRLNKEIYGMSEEEYQESLKELVELLELEECLEVPVKKLSLGQRMKAELAASLLHRPRLLLLDEPTLGLDVVMQKKVREFISHYVKRYKATVLLTSHNMGDVVELCSRVLIIERGRLIFDGPLGKVVERFAPHKIIRVDFSHPVPEEALSQLGSVQTDGLRATLEVPRREVSSKAAELLRRFPVVDLTIEETPIDEVVREIFRGNSSISVPKGSERNNMNNLEAQL